MAAPTAAGAVHKQATVSKGNRGRCMLAHSHPSGHVFGQGAAVSGGNTTYFEAHPAAPHANRTSDHWVVAAAGVESNTGASGHHTAEVRCIPLAGVRNDKEDTVRARGGSVYGSQEVLCRD